MTPSREMERVLYELANVLTDAQCRSTTKRADRAQMFLDNRTVLLRFAELIAEARTPAGHRCQLPVVDFGARGAMGLPE